MRKIVPALAFASERWLLARGWRRTVVLVATCVAYFGLNAVAVLSGGFQPFFYTVNFFFIVLFAASLGIWGALAAATVSGLVWGPFATVFIGLEHITPAVMWIIRMAVLELFGLLAGTATSVLRYQARVQRETNDQLVQAQKLESIGLLTGGIAHDFNNMLTAIGGYAELVARNAPRDPIVAGIVSDLLDVVRRSSGLTHQLMAIGRQNDADADPVDVEAETRALGTVLARILGEKIELELSFADVPWKVAADPVQIDQIIMNLAVNAADAMPEGGKLVISTQDLVVDTVFSSQHPQLRPGEYVMITVTDTGTGMDEATSERVFEAFFTTKQAGRGSGLGLSTVHGIVRRLNGDIWFQTAIGHGTSFKVCLPRAIDAPARSDRQRKSGGSASGAAPAMIMVAEDDETVRGVITRLLRLEGYRLVVVENGQKAIEALHDFGSRIDVLIADVVMPGQSGLDVLEYLSASYPTVKVILISGYPRHERTDIETGVPVGQFLQKPFTGRQLLESIHQVLRQTGA